MSVADKPKLLILGHARHGKDTVAEMLRDEHGFSFASSSFFVAEAAIRPALACLGVEYETLEDCYADRVNRRSFWYEAICAYNGGGASRLAAEILKTHNIYVGMRSANEYEASKDMFDQVLWVDASGRGIPPEPEGSMDIEYDAHTMIRIDNGGTLDQLRVQIAGVVDLFTLTKSPKEGFTNSADERTLIVAYLERLADRWDALSQEMRGADDVLGRAGLYRALVSDLRAEMHLI